MHTAVQCILTDNLHGSRQDFFIASDTCRLLEGIDFAEMKFSIYLLGYEKAEDISKRENCGLPQEKQPFS